MTFISQKPRLDKRVEACFNCRYGVGYNDKNSIFDPEEGTDNDEQRLDLYEEDFGEKLIDGKVIVKSPRPSINHDRIVFKIAHLLKTTLKAANAPPLLTA